MDLMASLARRGKTAMEVRNLAVQLTTAGFLNGQGLQQKDFMGEAARLLAFVRDDIRYVRDISEVETLHDPVTLLKIGAGDCDDKAILLAALLKSIGFDDVRFIAIAFAPDEYSHVWVQTKINGKWVDLESTEPISCGSSIPTRGAVSTLTQDV